MIDFGDYLASTDDRRDYCDDCNEPLASCRCEQDPVALAVLNVEQALDDLTTAIAHAESTELAHRLYRLAAELEHRVSSVTNAAMAREHALCA